MHPSRADQNAIIVASSPPASEAATATVVSYTLHLSSAEGKSNVASTSYYVASTGNCQTVRSTATTAAAGT